MRSAQRHAVLLSAIVGIVVLSYPSNASDLSKDKAGLERLAPTLVRRAST